MIDCKEVRSLGETHWKHLISELGQPCVSFLKLRFASLARVVDNSDFNAENVHFRVPENMRGVLIDSRL